MSKYGIISGPCFPVFGLNTRIYFVNLRIQSEYRKIQTRNNSVFGHFSCSESFDNYESSPLFLDLSQGIHLVVSKKQFCELFDSHFSGGLWVFMVRCVMTCFWRGED